MVSLVSSPTDVQIHNLMLLHTLILLDSSRILKTLDFFMFSKELVGEESENHFFVLTLCTLFLSVK